MYSNIRYPRPICPYCQTELNFVRCPDRNTLSYRCPECQSGYLLKLISLTFHYDKPSIKSFQSGLVCKEVLNNDGQERSF